MQLRGEIQFPEVVSPVDDAPLRIRLLDVSKADAASETVAEDVVEHVSLVTAGQGFPFLLEVDDLDERHTYTLEAHLDVDGSGDVAPGDYRTMEHFDVSPATINRHQRVVCRPIR